MRGARDLHRGGGGRAGERGGEPAELGEARGREEAEELGDAGAEERADEVAAEEGAGLGEWGVGGAVDEDGGGALCVGSVSQWSGRVRAEGPGANAGECGEGRRQRNIGKDIVKAMIMYWRKKIAKIENAYAHSWPLIVGRRDRESSAPVQRRP